MAQEKERIRSRGRFQNLPDELGSDRNSKTLLERLFQPQRRTKGLFDLGREIKIAKLAKLAMALYRGYWAYALLGAAVLLLPLLLVALAFAIEGWPLFFLIAASFIPAAILALLAAAIGACADIFYRLPANGYGLCSGSSNGVPGEAGVLPLTDWLHQLFQEIAGKEPGNDPVIFGELGNQDRDENAERDIDLVLMTTNVTRGISQRFPFLEGSWGQLFFRKEDFYLLFPVSVVDWLWEHADAPRHADKVEVPSDFRPLRKAANLRIILGVRMSLSFPFSAQRRAALRGQRRRKTRRSKDSTGKMLVLRWRPHQQLPDSLL
ncbi:MAG TPA: hypothetical protein VI075_06110 [Methyloceanibacter sp.]